MSADEAEGDARLASVVVSCWRCCSSSCGCSWGCCCCLAWCIPAARTSWRDSRAAEAYVPTAQRRYDAVVMPGYCLSGLVRPCSQSNVCWPGSGSAFSPPHVIDHSPAKRARPGKSPRESRRSPRVLLKGRPFSTQIASPGSAPPSRAIFTVDLRMAELSWPAAGSSRLWLLAICGHRPFTPIERN